MSAPLTQANGSRLLPVQRSGTRPREDSAATDPRTTVKADVERLLTSPLLSPKVSVSGHVYDIASGHVITTMDARYP